MEGVFYRDWIFLKYSFLIFKLKVKNEVSLEMAQVSGNQLCKIKLAITYIKFKYSQWIRYWCYLIWMHNSCIVPYTFYAFLLLTSIIVNVVELPPSCVQYHTHFMDFSISPLLVPNFQFFLFSPLTSAPIIVPSLFSCIFFNKKDISVGKKKKKKESPSTNFFTVGVVKKFFLNFFTVTKFLFLLCA